MADDALDELSYPFHELCNDPEFEYEFLLREWIQEHPELLWEWQEYGETGGTLLHVAVGLRETDMVRRMLEHGANPNARDQHGITPLLSLDDSDLDARPNKVPIMKLLLQYGADPNQADNNGNTPLHNTYHFWDLEERHAAIDLLVAHGADLNKPDGWGRTPLYEPSACETLSVLIGHAFESVQLLLEAEADINAKNHKGMTPLKLVEQEINLAFEDDIDTSNPFGEDLHHSLSFRQRKRKMLVLLRKAGGRI